MASNRRQFLERSLIAAGIVGFTNRSAALLDYVFAKRKELLPEGWQFYELGGQVLFSIYGANGGLSTSSCCWLIQQRGKDWYSIPIGFTLAEMMDENPDVLATNKLRNAIKTTKPVLVNLNGGSLPLPGEVR